MKLSVLLLLVPFLGQASSRLASTTAITERKLQDSNPCAIPLSEARSLNRRSLKPSYMANCLRSLEVPINHMLQHIRNLRDTFRDYHCFYDIANDVNASDPLSFQPEFGYKLFLGPNEGQVNLEKELTELIESVAANGSTIATFYDIQTIFNKVRDPHIRQFLLADDAGELTYTVLRVYPAKALRPQGSSDRLTLQDWEPSYNDNGVLEIKVAFDTVFGRREEMIDTIDGKTPFEWYYDLVSDPAVPWRIQSVGARMNKAFQTLRPRASNLAGTVAFWLSGRSLPPDIFPDTFTVRFVSGNEEAFISTANTNNWFADRIYDFVNSNPTFNTSGGPYDHFKMVLGEIEDAKPSDVRPFNSGPDEDPLDSPEISSSLSDAENDNFFDGYFEAFLFRTDSFEKVGAYRITDEYAIFKLWTFDFLETNSTLSARRTKAIPEFWSTFTAAAKNRTVKKAIVDISQNGGGRNNSGDYLAMSMYPNAPFEQFDDDYDITYNRAMSTYWENVMPLLDTVPAYIGNLTDEELQEKIDSLDRIGQQLLAIGQALLEYCRDATPDGFQFICSRLGSLPQTIDSLLESPSGPELRDVLEDLVELLPHYNPFSVLATPASGRIDPNERREVTRGGVSKNLTNRFGIVNINSYRDVVDRAMSNDWMFDEYAVIGDGTGGSTTMIFASKVMQLWNNRYSWWSGTDVQPIPIPLTTFSFGGTNLPDDTTIAGWPASVQRTNIAAPIIASGLLVMLELLVPGNMAQSISEGNQVYKSVLVQPPFYVSSLPRMPVYNHYSRFMDLGNSFNATPIQHVKVFSYRHFHIPKIYNGISGRERGDSSDLETLYSEVCELLAPPPIVVIGVTQP